jgi:hypothetical protein
MEIGAHLEADRAPEAEALAEARTAPGLILITARMGRALAGTGDVDEPYFPQLGVELHPSSTWGIATWLRENSTW